MSQKDSQSISEKYLETLKENSDWITVSEWAIAVGEKFPDLLDKANKEAIQQKNETTGLREIAARISSRLATGGFDSHVDIDKTERPKKVRYRTSQEIKVDVENELEEDLAPLTRAEKEKNEEKLWTVKEKYRISELRTIISQLKHFFNLDFEFEHSKALMNPVDPGRHHPDNIQLLWKSHNARKNNDNWERFTIEEQIEYIRSLVRVQELVSSRMKIEIEKDVINSLMERLKSVY